MRSSRIFGIVLVVLGVLGLIYDRLTYTEERHDAAIGPIDISIEEKETIQIPVWAGVAAIVIGVGLTLVPMQRRTA
jgi:hypothetical protein